PREYPRTLATPGWTTDELSSAMDAAQPPLGRYDFVSLLIGVNNQYRGRSTAEYRGDFHELLGRSIALAYGRADRVLVLSIPDWGGTPCCAARGRHPATVGGAPDAAAGLPAAM